VSSTRRTEARGWGEGVGACRPGRRVVVGVGGEEIKVGVGPSCWDEGEIK
jgi:hypothetical protein